LNLPMHLSFLSNSNQGSKKSSNFALFPPSTTFNMLTPLALLVTCARWTVCIEPDVTSPVLIGCPVGMQTLATESGKGYATFTYTLQALDDCDGQVFNSAITEQYSVGTVPVEMELQDNSGNPQRCDFQV